MSMKPRIRPTSDSLARIPRVLRFAHYEWSSGASLKLLWGALSVGSCAHPRPRLHDLRHAFACRILTRWSKHPVALDQRILFLMHYLGHTHISHTYWYLSAIPELLSQAAVRFERHADRPSL
jgi:integrase